MVSLGVLPLAKSFETMFMGSAGSGEYWISLFDSGGFLDQGFSVTIDSSDNIITVGRIINVANSKTDILIAKQNSLGTLLWEKTLGSAVNYEFGAGVEIDSSDNIIVTGGDGFNGILAKYNSSGTLQWQKSLDFGISGTTTSNGRSVAVDSNDNIIICGTSYRSSLLKYDIVIAKFNSSGATVWSRYLTKGDYDSGTGVAIDSSDNVIITGTRQTLSPNQDHGSIVAKYNSSGTLQWQIIWENYYTVRSRSVAIDSSDNIIVTGRDSANRTYAMKLNSSGTLQWQTAFSNNLGNNQGEGYGVAIDSSDNVIITGRVYEVTKNYVSILVAKFNSSGTLQWDKTLGRNSLSGDEGYGIAIDSSDNVIVTGLLREIGSSDSDALTAKLPPDGSGDGTYGGIVYQDASMVATSGANTLGAGNFVAGTASLSNTAGSKTSADAVMDSKLYPVGA